jgi:H+/Cl- antiporter ClcA
MNDHVMWIVFAIAMMCFGWALNAVIKRIKKATPKDQALVSVVVGLLIGVAGLVAEQILYVFPIIGLALSMMKQFDDSL